MKKVLLASTAVAAFIAFSGAAQAQDPGRADFGATEGGGGAGSAFTVSTSGAVKFYLKYASADKTLTTNDGFFTLINGELEINGAATTDNGIDIETHVDFGFAGTDSDVTSKIGGEEQPIFTGRLVQVDELSMKISGGFGSVEMGRNDGAEDIFKMGGASVGAGTGGINGDHHQVVGAIPGARAGGGSAASGDSGDHLKVTYLSPVFVGIQAGVSVGYATGGPNYPESDTQNLTVGLGAKYSGSASGLDYAVSLVWGAAEGLLVEDSNAPTDGFGAIGIGLSLGGAGVSFATGITIDELGKEIASDTGAIADPSTPIYWSGGVAYNIADVANVSLTTDVAFDTGHEVDEANGVTSYLVFASADYAVLPGVTLALDLGYGDSDTLNDASKSSGFSGVLRVKAAF